MTRKAGHQVAQKFAALAALMLALASCGGPTPPPVGGGSETQVPWSFGPVATPDPSAISGTPFLSDLNWISANNSLGPIEKDKSNGNQAEGDGRTLTIGSQTFTKGLGVYANSEMVYALGGKCTRFQAIVGIDAEVKNNAQSSVIFQVFNGDQPVGAAPLFASPVMKSTTPGLSVDVDITGVKTLRLVVTDAGDGSNFDHADWANAKVVCVPEIVPGAPQILAENLDGFPTNTRLVFSNLGSRFVNRGDVPQLTGINGVHDTVILRLKNASSNAPLIITALPITPGWVIDPPPALPITVAPGADPVELPVKFNLPVASRNTTVYKGTLTVTSNDPVTPNLKIDLSGLWQREAEKGIEPTADQIRDAFGLDFTFGPGNINQKGAVVKQPASDEVISAYWQRLDPSQPVVARQIAAYHTQNSPSTLRWFKKGSGDNFVVLQQFPADSQTLFPRGADGKSLAIGSINPTTAFGWNADGEKSDPALNRHQEDTANGCTEPCGQHVRFFPLKDVPGSYYMIMDYAGFNYDYNDNVYILSNITPAVAPPPPPVVTPIVTNVALFNAGGTADVTDPATGLVWKADTSLYAPGNVVSDGGYYTNPILNADGSPNTNPIYRTYRSCTGQQTPKVSCDESVPQANRVVTFNIPVANGTYKVNLHFAELFFKDAGQRIMNITVQGKPVATGFDIAERAGLGKVYILPLTDVAVTNGQMTLSFAATKNFVSISGIQIGN